MKKAKVEITIIQTDSGRIRIQFADGSSYPVPDIIENIGIVSGLEVELEWTIKKNNENTTQMEKDK